MTYHVNLWSDVCDKNMVVAERLNMTISDFAKAGIVAIAIGAPHAVGLHAGGWNGNMSDWTTSGFRNKRNRRLSPTELVTGSTFSGDEPLIRTSRLYK